MLAGLAVMLALATPAAAATPTRTCAQRAEIGHPTAFRTGSARDVRLGPVIFGTLDGMKRLTSAELRKVQGRLPFHKSGALVKASSVVTLSIAPESRRFARVAYDTGNRSASASLDQHPVSVIIRACPKDEPAFSYAGPVGPATAFPGGFITDGKGKPRCVTIELRERGKTTVYRRTVAFGAVRCPSGG